MAPRWPPSRRRRARRDARDETAGRTGAPSVAVDRIEMNSEGDEQNYKERPVHDVPEREETLVRDPLRYAPHRAQVSREVLARDSLEALAMLRHPRRAHRLDEQS